jgi:flagellin
MGRINTNVQSLIAQRVLSQNSQNLNTSLERLSTGLKINRGKDDPAGLIASQNLAADQAGLNQAITNAQRTDQVANIAEGGLQEVSGLLTNLQGLITASASSAGLSVEEKNANQLQIDSILQTIDRVSSATDFQGIKLLNGNFDFKVSGVAAGVTDYKVNGAKFSGSSLGVDVQVTTSAQQAGVFLSAGGSAIDTNTGSSLVLEISGSKGSRELTFSSGTTLANITATINSFTDVTGVQASTSGTGVKLMSTDFGSDQFVSVKVVNDAGINLTANGDSATPTRGIYNLNSADFNSANTTAASSFSNSTAKNGVTDKGQNMAATINGIQATAEGKTIRINTDFLDTEMTLSTSASQTLGTVGGSNGAFTITGGGASFQLAGNVDIAGKVSLGIQDVAARKLGNSDIGFLDSLSSGKANNVVDGSTDNAQKIVSEAIKQVSGLRGRLGAFQQNTVGATIRSLNVQVENTAAAQSVIQDADFAAETANMTRAQILVSASTNVLSMANSQPQSVLQLLRGA